MATRTRPTAADILYPGGALLAFVLAWWAVATLLELPPFLLPTPGAVAGRLVGNPGLFVTHALSTLEKVLYGGAAGVGSGFVLASALANLPLLRRAVYPYLVTVRVLPKVAVAPLLLLYLGTGTLTAVVFVALISVFPMVLSTAAGLDRAPAQHRDLLGTFKTPVESGEYAGAGWQEIDLAREPYHAYLYATGSVGALALVRALREGDLAPEQYREMLARGRSVRSNEAFQPTLDFTDEATVDRGIDADADRVDALLDAL